MVGQHVDKCFSSTDGTKSGKPYSNTLADRIRRRSRRTKSLTKDQWADEVAFAKVESKFPAYERIVLKMPHFQRPIVFYGPLADIAREKLVQEFPERYAGPRKHCFIVISRF